MKEKMGEKAEQIKPYLYVLIAIMVVGGVWYSYDQFFSYAGVTNHVTAEIRNVEVTERYGEHTTIWADHATGDGTFIYTLVGKHDLVIGATYRIEYVNRVKVLPASLRLALWGDVVSIEEIQ